MEWNMDWNVEWNDRDQWSLISATDYYYQLMEPPCNYIDRCVFNPDKCELINKYSYFILWKKIILPRSLLCQVAIY